MYLSVGWLRSLVSRLTFDGCTMSIRSSVVLILSQTIADYIQSLSSLAFISLLKHPLPPHTHKHTNLSLPRGFSLSGNSTAFCVHFSYHHRIILLNSSVFYTLNIALTTHLARNLQSDCYKTDRNEHKVNDHSLSVNCNVSSRTKLWTESWQNFVLYRAFHNVLSDYKHL
jgi:hypothetical protein